MISDDNRHFDADTLEFPLFCDTMRRGFVSSFASERASRLSLLRSPAQLREFQEDLKAVFNLFHGTTPPKTENDNAFYLLFNRLNDTELRYFSLEPDDYRNIRNFILQTASLKNYLVSKKSVIARLDRLVNALNPDTAFARTIEETFDENGQVKDSATPALHDIRRKIRDTKRRIQSILQDTFNKSNADKFIQEQVVVLRNGRYTIPCKTNFSQYMSGIIHDRSASGQTVYVEPSNCVPLNNDMQDTILAESAEVARILAMLMERFKDGMPELKITVEAYTGLTFFIETAVFYYKYDYTFPEFGEDILFKEIHHPLLAVNKGADSIPLDLSLNKEENLIVVSGPNTGGKTASLKSVGLNHLIGMCGLPLIGKRARLVMFDNILADIGDKQSLVMDLSTFSSHMSNINRIISQIKGSSLLLFDELGTGTDPKEGAALAVSILDYLKNRGARVMVTTHFSEVKSYAFDRPDAKMYAVDFDYETFEPTYRLLEGVAGRSDPIIIADRLGFPREIIADARQIMDRFKSRSEVMLEELNLMRAEAEHTKRVLEERQREIEKKEQEIEQSGAELKQRLSKKELELLEDTMALLQKGKRLASERLKESPDKIAGDIEKVADKIQKIKATRKPVEEIKPGDLIYLEKYSKIAKILSVDNTYAQIDMEGMKVKIKREDLVGRKVKDEKPKSVKVTSQKISSARNELLLVGKRVEEALDMLDKYLDKSRLSGYDKVYIIHGRGSGQLRKAIHDYLRVEGKVRHYAIASAEEGGNAVTVVEL